MKFDYQCDRCGTPLHEDEVHRKDPASLDYCECCYSDLYVSWNDVWQQAKARSQNVKSA